MPSLSKPLAALVAVAALTAPAVPGVASAVSPAAASAPESRRAVPAVSMAPAVGVPPAVVADGDHLALKVGGKVQPYDFTGINAYQLASDWNVNYGCGWGGWNTGSLSSFFSQVKPNQLVRTWAFQYEATNRYTGQRDWTALDQVVAAADASHAHLVLTLGNQDGTCDDSLWKDDQWYGYRYKDVFNPDGSTPTSYLTWVKQVVTRYRGNPAIAMWEPMNEPQPATCTIGGRGDGPSCWGHLTCPSEVLANTDVTSFFATIGGLIHTIDPGPLVSDGSLGGGECGYATSADFTKVISSPGIDVVGYHDYSGMVALPPDLPSRVQEADALHKPTMIGEAGIFSCPSATVEAAEFKAKIAAAFATGVSAYLPWRYDNDNGDPQCNGIINFGSPTMQVVAGAAVAVASS